MRQGPLLSRDDVEAFLDREFPQIHIDGRIFHVEEVGPMRARMRMDFTERHLRPGGTISGPAMMTLTDLALYVAVIAQIGPIGLAVTTNLSFNFVRKPKPGVLVADARLFKLGRRLAVGEVFVHEGDVDKPVCHATGTYSIPDKEFV